MAVRETMVAGNPNIDDPQAHNAVSNAKTFREESAAFARISLYINASSPSRPISSSK
jgi:hypothetical protein